MNYSEPQDGPFTELANKAGQTCDRIQRRGTSTKTGWSLDGSGTYSPGPILTGVWPNELTAKKVTFWLKASALATLLDKGDTEVPELARSFPRLRPCQAFHPEWGSAAAFR